MDESLHDGVAAWRERRRTSEWIRTCDVRAKRFRSWRVRGGGPVSIARAGSWLVVAVGGTTRGARVRVAALRLAR